MARLATFILMLALVSKVLTQTQPTLSQYLQLAGLGNYIPNPAPNYQPHPNQRVLEVSRPTVPSAPTLPIPSVNLPSVPISPKSLSKDPSNANVLNNLAIALQLLIVSNILSTPPCEPFSKVGKLESLPVPSIPTYVDPKHYYESIPNSNFLGSSSLVDPSALTGIAIRPNPRANMALMSPYEALGPSSQFTDPILSTVYAPTYSKKDFQSPYAAILSSDGNRDLYSLADLF